MDEYVVLDTNALPRSFRGLIWKFLFYLARRKGFHVSISEVVLEESINMKVAEASVALDALTKNHRVLAEMYPDMADLYTPSIDEVSASIKSQLEQHFTILPVDHKNASEALRREARRILPAREGRGARDAAIWLTVRDLCNGGHKVHFVTNNSKDFGKDTLEEFLLDEIRNPESISYYPNLGQFIMQTAPMEPDVVLNIESNKVAKTIKRSIESEIYSSIEHLLPTLTLDEFLDAEVSIENWHTLKPYRIDDTCAFPVRGRASVRYESTQSYALEFTGWLLTDATASIISSCESTITATTS